MDEKMCGSAGQVEEDDSLVGTPENCTYIMWAVNSYCSQLFLSVCPGIRLQVAM